MASRARLVTNRTMDLDEVVGFPLDILHPQFRAVHDAGSLLEGRSRGRGSATALCEVRRRAVVAIQHQHARSERSSTSCRAQSGSARPDDYGVITIHFLGPRDDAPVLSRLNTFFRGPMPPLPV